MKNPRFIFTKHLRERYQERFYTKKGEFVARELDREISNQLRTSKENKSIHNNTSFMAYIFKTYQRSDIRFFCTDEVIFVVGRDDVVITCYPRNTTIAPHLSQKRKKYKKKVETESIEDQLMPSRQAYRTRRRK